MNRKSIINTIFLFIVSVLIFSGFTIAYLTARTNPKTNSFHPGVLTASIVENGGLSNDTEIIEPNGTNANKQVQVKNIANPHEIDCYIRVMLVPVFRTSQGTLAGNMSLDPVSDNIIVTAPNGGTVTLKLPAAWDNDWIYENGYYYYKNIVHPGQNTSVLLSSVEVSNEDLWDSFCLEILSDAVQAEGQAALTAWGSGITNQLEAGQ